MTAESGPPLKRYYGKWDATYSRFTTNLTSAKIRVEALRPGKRSDEGVMCVLHWVNRKDMVRSDKGSVCYGDGWPTELWNAFASQSGILPKGSVAEMLQSFLHSGLLETNVVVKHWRARVRAGFMVPAEKRSTIDDYWLPVPATLVSDEGPSKCIVSWSPGASFYRSISKALASSEATWRRPDMVNQAKYYLECTLSKLHGVRFGPDDHLEDRTYVRTAEIEELRMSFERLERQRIADPKLGLLDRFVAQR